MRWVVGCNHGAKKIRLPRPALSRWRKVVKNDLPEMIGVDHLTSDPRAVNMQHGQPVSERVCTQELARKGWTSLCGGRENIGFSKPKQGWVRTIQDADPAAEPKAAEPKAAEPKASGKAPELSKEVQLRLQEAREAQAQRLEEQERRRHAAEANIGLPTSAKPPVAKKETLVQLYQAASPEGKQLAYNAMAKLWPKSQQCQRQRLL